MPIRQYQSSDKENLLQLISDEVSPSRSCSLRKYWDWQFFDNPFVTGNGPIILLLEEDKKIVGALLSFPVPMKIQDREVTAHCMTDFIVHPNYRGGGIGLALEMSGLPHHFYGFPSASSHLVWQKLGSTDFVDVESLSMVANMKKFLMLKGINSFVAGVIDVLWTIKERITGNNMVKHSTAVTISRIEYFDESFDNLWETAKKQHAVAIVKNQKYLNWRYTRCPKDYAVFTASSNGKTVGFIVARIADTYPVQKGHIVDMMTVNEDPETADMLIQRAICQLKDLGASSIHCMLTAKYFFLKSRLRRNGFIFNRVSSPLVGNPHFLNTCKQSDLAAENWFLTKGDGELDLIPDN